jgi:hypothetical protein
MKNRLLSQLISVLILVSHIHFWPVGTSLFVFARLIFFDSLSAFFLGMILDLAVETVFSVPVPVVSGPGIIAIGDNISIKSTNVKLNINDVCNLISVSSERFN